jgi:hypothetical protein
MPVAPLRGWTEALARQTPVPILAVDTACVVPMQLVGKPYERAFAFRNATKRLYEERVSRTTASSEPIIAAGTRWPMASAACRPICTTAWSRP